MAQAGALVSIGSGIIVLPLMVGVLTQAEIALWLYYALFLNLGMLTDFGFGHALVRAAAYFKAGAHELPGATEGEKLTPHGDRAPNRKGLNALLATFGRCYWWIVASALILTLGVGGGLSISVAERTVDPSAAYWSGILIWCGLGFAMVAGVWGNYLQGLGKVAEVKQVEVVVGLARISFYALMLLAGGGVMGMAFGSLAISVTQWLWLRGRAKAAHLELGGEWPIQGEFDKTLFRNLWPATWRQGAIGLGGYFINQSGGLLASRLSDTNILAAYLLTSRLLSIIRGLALAPVQVAVPRIIALRAAGDRQGLKHEVLKRVAICVVIAGLAPIVIWLAVELYVVWTGRLSPVLPYSLYVLAAVIGLLETHHCAHSIIYITKNKVPFLWASILSGLAIIGLGSFVVQEFGVWGLLIVQGGVQALFNNWYPVWLVLRDIRTPNRAG